MGILDILLFALGVPLVGYLSSNKESFSDGVRVGSLVIGGIVLVLYVVVRVF